MFLAADFRDLLFVFSPTDEGVSLRKKEPFGTSPSVGNSLGREARNRHSRWKTFAVYRRLSNMFYGKLSA